MVLPFLVLSYSFLFHPAPPRALSVPAAAVQTAPTDTVDLLSGRWVLRQKLWQEQDSLKPILPLPDMIIVFSDSSSYKMLRRNGDTQQGEQVVERGLWDLNPTSGVIAVKVQQVNERLVQTTLVSRWQIVQLQPDVLVLQYVGKEREFLVFEKQP